jgi:hypothetical protein
VAQNTANLAAMALKVAAVTAAVAALGLAAKMAGNALDAQARHLSQFSGDLAGSTAQADIRRMMSEMERARSVGPGLAQFQSDWSRAMNTFYQLGTSMLELLMKLYELFRPFVDAVQIVLDIIAAALEVLVDLVKIIVDVITLNPDIIKDLRELKDDVVKWLKKIADRDGSDDLEDQFAQELLAPVGGLNFPGEAPKRPGANKGGAFGGLPGGGNKWGGRAADGAFR